MTQKMEPGSLLIRAMEFGEAFEVIHEPCLTRLLYTQRVHVDTLLNIDHTCLTGGYQGIGPDHP